MRRNQKQKSMESEKEKKGLDINDWTINVDVDDEVIDKVRTGEVTHIVLDINDDNYLQILENEDGNLAVITETLPESYYGFYYYNNGVYAPGAPALN